MLGAAASAQASLVLSWGGDYVSTYQGVVGTPTSSGGASVWAYSDTVAKSPDASVYSGPKFYGAFSLINASGAGVPTFDANRFGVANAAGTDGLRFGASAMPGEGAITMRGLVFFKKEDFANGSSGTVTLDNDTVFSLNVTSSLSNSTSPNVRRYQFAVEALVGGVWGWYISNDYSSGTTTLTLSDAGVWAPYIVSTGATPLEAAPTPGNAAYSVAGSLFEDIRSVGYYFNYRQDGTAANFVTQFKVEATVVPEPGVAVLGGAGALALLLRRHARKMR